MESPGLARRIAAAFIQSKITPLLILVSLLMGIGATVVLPREEEPQIVVPMADVMIAMPGASAAEVEQRVTSPMEKVIKEITGVEYVYSTSKPGQSLIIVRFYVGENPEAALVRLYNKLYSSQDRVPPGVQWPPLVKLRSIDDVPILALTLHGGGLDGFQLRQIAEQLDEQIKQVDNVSETDIIGGPRRELRVELQPARLGAYGLSVQQVLGAIQAANSAAESGRYDSRNHSIVLRTGDFLTSADDVRNVVVGTHDMRPIYMRDVATVVDGPEESQNYVFFGEGPSGAESVDVGGTTYHRPLHGVEQAVTISVAKRRGSNAIVVADDVISKMRDIRSHYMPRGVQMTITRNYGERAAEG